MPIGIALRPVEVIGALAFGVVAFACTPAPQCTTAANPASPANSPATLGAQGREPEARAPTPGSTTSKAVLQTEHERIPGWFLAGSGPRFFEIARDPEVKHRGDASARLQATADPGQAFGTLMQSVAADDYVGKRLRLTAFVRTDQVSGWAGLWMRVDTADNTSDSFDNMQDRPITGTTDWTQHSLVLDVQRGATSLHYGVLQEGAGTTWMDDLTLEVVDTSVPTTGPSRGLKPANLGFEAI